LSEQAVRRNPDRFFISVRETAVSPHWYRINPKNGLVRGGGKKLCEKFFEPKHKEWDVSDTAQSASISFDFGIETLNRSVCRRIIQYLS